MKATSSAVILSFLLPHAATASEWTLTFDEVVRLARERAPTVLAARARVLEAQGRRQTTGAFLGANPELEAAAGPRRSDRGDFTDLEFALTQEFELGGRRRGRIDRGEAEALGAIAGSEDLLRRTLRDAVVTFLRGLHAERRVQLAQAAEAVGEDLVRVAERRHARGEVAILDVNLARAALGRARADGHAAVALRQAALGELRILLDIGAEDSIAVVGELRDAEHPDLALLIVQGRHRPDLQVLEAEGRAAAAELQLGRGQAWPELGLGARYERDEGADVLLGTVQLGLPLFVRGQGLRTEASARVRRMQFELEAGRRAAEVEVRTAYEIHAQRRRAVAELESQALPLLDANETLARRSYDAGQIGLAELLLVRRETLETRLEYLDRLLEVAIAGVELEATAGVLR